MLSYFSKCKESSTKEPIEGLGESPEWMKYLEDAQTGDLLLFHGSGFWFSYMVEWMTHSDFSHIGMILKDPTYIHPDLQGIYMLESGTENFPDAVEHRIKYGVQIVSIQKLMENYDGRVYLKKLSRPEIIPVGTGIAESFDSVIHFLWNKIADLPYDNNVWDLIRIEFGLDWGNMHRENKFFCSALVTFLYDSFGIFQHKLTWDLIEPEDFNDGKKVEKDLIDGFSLEPKILIQEKY